MMLLLLLVLAIIGLPLFVVIASNALLGYQQAELPFMALPIEFYGLAETPVLLAIPLFTFAGYLLSESQAPARLVRLTQAFLGWMPGGLSLVAIVALAFFSAFTGVSGVTIIALGALLYPALLQAKYPAGFSLGVITTSGSLGMLFAPSLPLIMYGVIAKVSIDELFVAALLPGLLLLLALAVWGWWQAPKGAGQLQSFSAREVLGALRGAAWEIPLPIVVLGGVYSGRLAVSDAAVVTVVYAFLVEVVIRREIRWRDLPALIREAMILVGAILMIIGVSLASTNILIDQGVPQKLLEMLAPWVEHKVIFLLLLLLFFIVLGAIIDIFSAIVLVVPLLLPLADQFGIHPIHLGIMFLAAMELGFITPPVGLNLFISSFRFNRSILEVYKATIPFFLIMLLMVLVILFWPALSLWSLTP